MFIVFDRLHLCENFDTAPKYGKFNITVESDGVGKPNNHSYEDYGDISKEGTILLIKRN